MEHRGKGSLKGLVTVIAAVLLLGVPGGEAEAQSRGPTQQSASTWNVDLSGAVIENFHRNDTDWTAGVRVGTPLWYSPVAWRFQAGLRASAQLNTNTRLTLHPMLSLEAGLRFILFRFLSFETYVGPRVGGQFGAEGSVLTTGVGATAAYLFHFGRDNRNRFRLGAEYFRLDPRVGRSRVDGIFDLYHFGFFMGYEVAF